LKAQGAPPSFRIATYNVENYLLQPVGTRSAKSSASRKQVQQNLLSLRADVLALQEIGTTNALLELREALHREGLEYRYWEYVRGFDTNLHVAVLSRFPFTERRPHSYDTFLIHGRRFMISRGIAELKIQVGPSYSFTLLAAHLKSKRPLAVVDQAALREAEARILRQKIDRCLTEDPDVNLVVLGDLNDTPNSMPLRILRGRGRKGLIDTRPAERCASDPGSTGEPTSGRSVTWTYFYGAEDTYQRFDYILLSRAMAQEWLPHQSYVRADPAWGEASDHRPVVVTLTAQDR
jgi:endonuclease/exonuclease/phosphatase family metal-dependent hydrolase